MPIRSTWWNIIFNFSDFEDKQFLFSIEIYTYSIYIIIHHVQVSLSPLNLLTNITYAYNDIIIRGNYHDVTQFSIYSIHNLWFVL